MESKSINRYHSFCKSLQNLSKSVNADPDADFVLEGTVLNFNLTFDISWKVMKDILIKELGILDFAIGSPRETLKQAFMNGIIDNDEWMQMLRVRNQLAHDYDGTFAAEMFQNIIKVYYPLFEKLAERVEVYYKQSMG
ncbi:MAG: toxin-antitoxin system antitoxin subunit [Lachnospiraceae bacterium]|jgi:nucleotidyltransferase substrate binding protein (TIGR01987 family)|nr:toxin-antitoxin system antitoxin subunit [Lachnospiraceae bacterium]